MSQYTDSRSRPGAAGSAGTDDRAIFLTEFAGMVIESNDEANDWLEMSWKKAITQGKSDTFPIIGRKRDASEHVPGEMIVGGTIDHNQIEISLDNVMYDSAFIAEVDELIAHYALARPYAKQLGMSLGSTTSKRIAIMHILASRDITTDRPGQPVPGYCYHANMATSGSELETAFGKAAVYLKENDISGEMPSGRLPWATYFLLSRYSGIEEAPVTSGSGNRSTGKVGLIQGIQPYGTNHLPSTNLSATGPSKYRGNFSTTVGCISSRMAVGTLERRGIRVVMKKVEERLGTLLIASVLNGHGKLRNECAIELRTDEIAGRAQLD